MNRESVFKGKRSSNASKACQESDFPTKVIKDNDKRKLHPFRFNACIIQLNIFSSFLNTAEVTPILRKDSKLKKKIADPLVFYHTYYQIFYVLVKFYKTINADLENVLILDTAS